MDAVYPHDADNLPKSCYKKRHRHSPVIHQLNHVQTWNALVEVSFNQNSLCGKIQINKMSNGMLMVRSNGNGNEQWIMKQW